jgi:hypothetical protein
MLPRAYHFDEQHLNKMDCYVIGIEKLVMKQGKNDCLFLKSDQKWILSIEVLYVSVMHFVQKQSACKIKGVTPNVFPYGCYWLW